MEKNNRQKLPATWMTVELSEIADIVTGSTPSTKNSLFYGNDVPFFKPTDLNNGYWVNDSKVKLSHKGAKESRWISAKTILVTCIGATIGKTGFCRVQGTTNQQINSILPVPNFIIPEYLYFVCISYIFQKSILVNSSSTTLPIINKSKFSKLTIPLPPLNEQKRIVAKIENLFSEIELSTRYLEKIRLEIKRYKQSLLKSALEGKLVSQDPNDEPAQRLLDKIKYKRHKNDEDELELKGKNRSKFQSSKSKQLDAMKLSKLPVNWTWTRVGEIFDFNYGKSLSDEKRDGGKFPVYGSSGIIGQHSTPLTKEHCLIVGRKGAAGEVHRSTTMCWSIDTTYFVYVPNELDFDFVYYAFLGKKRDFVDNSTAVPSLVRDKAYDVIIPIPPLNEQKRIVAKIESNLSLIEKNEKVIDRLLLQNNSVKNSILKQSLEGKLVPQDPRDESAAALFQKIKQEKQKIADQTLKLRKKQ